MADEEPQRCSVLGIAGLGEPGELHLLRGDGRDLLKTGLCDGSSSAEAAEAPASMSTSDHPHGGISCGRHDHL